MAVETGTATQEQHRAMVDLVERKIRLRAHQLYEERGHVEGFAVEDWLKAESDVLKTSILAPLYRRSHDGGQLSPTSRSGRGALSESQNSNDAVGRPPLTSYDSGYEHSLDHWIELQRLVREAEDGFPVLALAADHL